MAVDMGTAKGFLDLDTSKFKKGLKSALDDLKAFQSEGATTKDKFSAFGSAATSAGKSLTKGLTAPIVGLGAASVKVTARFEKSLSEVEAISGQTGKATQELVSIADEMGLAYKKNADGSVDAMEILSAKAQEMGAKTKFSASESAEAFKYMALAGWDAGDMLNGIEGIMNLAAASGEDLASVSDIVTDSLTAFGMSASESTHFADVLATAMSKSNTDVAGLGEAFKYVGPVAGAFGYTVEDVSTALGLMANAGIKGSSMGTALRQSLVQLTSPSAEAKKYMEKYGVSLYDSQGNTKDLMTVMKDLRGTFKMTGSDVKKLSKDELNDLQTAVEQDAGAWDKYVDSMPINQQEKLTALTEIFGAHSMPAMLAIIQAGEKDFNDLAGAMHNADGTAEEMSEIMMDNLPGAITLAKSALEGLGIRIGQQITPTLTKIIQSFTKFIAWLTKASDGTVAFAVGLGVLLASIGPVLFALGTMANKIVSLITLYEKMSTILKGKAVTGFLASAKAKMVDTAASVKNAAANIFNSKAMTAMGTSAKAAVAKVLALAMAHKVATGAIFGIIGILAGVAIYMYKTGTSASEMKDKIVNMFNNLVEQLPKIMSTVAEVASGIVQQIPSMIQSALTSLGEIVRTGLENLKTALPEIAQWWANDMPKMIQVGTEMIVNIINGFGQMLPELIATGSDMLVQLIDQFFAQLPTFIDAGLQIIMSLIEGITQAIPQLVSALSGILTNNLGPIITQVIGVVMAIGNALIQNLPILINAAVQIVQALTDALIQNAPIIIEGAVQLMIALVTGLIKALPQLIAAAAQIAFALVQAILAIIGAMFGAGAKIGMALIRGIGSMGGALLNKGKQLGKRALKGVIAGLGNLISTGRAWVRGLGNGIRGAFGSVISNARGFARRIPQGIKSALGSLTSAGRDLIQGLWNGMKAKFDSAISWAKGKAANLPKAVKKILGIGSPSWIMHEYGEWFIEGLENGITAGYKPLMRTLNRQMNSILDVYTPMADYDFGIRPTADSRLLEAIGGISVPASHESGGNMININNTVDGAESPEDFAQRLTRQLQINLRTV